MWKNKHTRIRYSFFSSLGYEKLQVFVFGKKSYLCDNKGDCGKTNNIILMEPSCRGKIGSVKRGKVEGRLVAG